MAQVSVTVNNQTYTLACDDGEEAHLVELTRIIDKRISDVKQDVKNAGDQQLMLMTALLLADELELARERIQDLEESLAGMKGEYLEPEQVSASKASLDEEKLSGLLESAAKRMEDIAARMR